MNKVDPEMIVMQKCTEAFIELDSDARVRVLNYLISRFEINTPEQIVNQNINANTGGQSGVNSNSSSSSSKIKGKPKPPNRQTQTTKSKSVPKAGQKYSIVSDLDLYPKDKLTLKDFFSNHNAKKFFEKNLAYVYYLRNVLGVNPVTINHVYTCYKGTNQKIPGNLYQSLVDTRDRKGWLDTRDMNDIQVAVPGANHLEHELTVTTED